MYTLQIQLRYTVVIAGRLSKWSKSKVEAEVKQVFRDMKVPNLGILGKITLELGDRIVSVQCRAKRHSSLYHDFSTLKEALSEGNLAEVWEKKGIVSIQLKEINDRPPAENYPTKWVYSAVAEDSKIKPEHESLSVSAAATHATSASTAPGAGSRRLARALEAKASSDATFSSSLSEPSLSPPGHSPSQLNPLSPPSALQQPSARANAVEGTVDCDTSDKRLPSSSSRAGGMPISSAPMPSGTWYDYNAPLPTTTTSFPSTSAAPLNRQPVPPLPSRRRHRPTTDVAVNPYPPLPDLSLPHSPGHDAMVCGESNAGGISNNTNEESETMTATSPPYIPSSPPYIPSSPPYRPTTPRINVAVADSRKATRPNEVDDVLKSSPPIVSQRPLLSPPLSSSLGKRRAEEAWAPSQSYNRDDDGDDAMRCDVDVDPFSSESEQSAFVSSWLNPQPSTFTLPPPCSRQASGSSSSSSSSSSSGMPPVDVSRLTIKRPRRYANSSTEEEDESEESGKSFLESRKAKRTGVPARTRRTTTTKPYDQAKRSSKSRKQDSGAQSDNDGGSTSSSSSSDSSSSTSSSQRSASSKSKPNSTTKEVNSDSEATVVTTGTIQMNPGLSDAELLTAWREAGGRLFESIQELVDLKKMIYHGIGERLIEERKRECGHCKNDFERDLKKLGRKLLRQEYKRLSQLL